MLVLTRKLNESIQIGDNIEITVLSVQGDQIKLGIKAPRDIEVHRKEVYMAIQESNNEAASILPNILDILKNTSKNLKWKNLRFFYFFYKKLLNNPTSSRYI